MKSKKKMKKRTLFVIMAIANIFWYTVVVLLLNAFDKEVQSELTIAWFAAWTVELALLANIKIRSKNSDGE